MEPPSGGEWEQVEDRTPLHTAHTELAPAPARPLTYSFISLAESLFLDTKLSSLAFGCNHNPSDLQIYSVK